MAINGPEYVLHTYFRSSCSGRVRIALNLKGIPYEPIPINIVKGEHNSQEYGEINPLKFLPSLTIKSGQDAGEVLTQSIGILEYLEEKHPDSMSLLPPKDDLAGRAHVRALVNVIACDVQPVTNERILKKVAADGGNDKEWAHWLMTEGFAAYERLAAPTSGKFSYGNTITMADICVVPAVWRSARFGVNMDDYPTMKKVFEAMGKEDAVMKAHWKNQPDCPEDLRN